MTVAREDTLPPAEDLPTVEEEEVTSALTTPVLTTLAMPVSTQTEPFAIMSLRNKGGADSPRQDRDLSYRRYDDYPPSYPPSSSSYSSYPSSTSYGGRYDGYADEPRGGRYDDRRGDDRCAFPIFFPSFPSLSRSLCDSSRPHPQQTAHPLLPAAGNTRTVPTSLPEAEALPAEVTTALLPLLVVAMTPRGAEEEGAMSTPRR